MAERKLKKRADGRYRRYVKTGKDPITNTAIRQPVYGRTLAEVNQAARDLREQVTRGEHVINKKTLIGDYADIWLAATISPTRKKSYAQYYQIINGQIKIRFKDIKISEIKTSQIQKEITEIENEGKLKTAVLFRMTIIRIMSSALNDDLCIRNYAAATKKPEYEAKEKLPLSEKEIDTLLETELSAQDRLFAVLCLFQGLRKSESLGLTRVTGEKLRINQAWECINNKPSITPKTKTTAGAREMNIMPAVNDALQVVQAGHKRMYLFSNADGSLLTEEQYKGMWGRIMTAFNIASGGVQTMGRRNGITIARHITSHYLRHTFATMLYYAEFDILQTQYLLGQDDVKTTLEVYTHLDKINLGKKNKYTKYKDLLREVFLNEKRSESVQNDKV